MRLIKMSWPALLAIATLACQLSMAPPTPEMVVVYPPTPLPTWTASPTPTITLTPTETLTPTPTETPLPPTATLVAAITLTLAAPLTPVTFTPVVIIAETAALNIRRGPGTGYDVVATLNEKQSADAVARNEDSTWFMIPLPKDPSEFGWVSWSSYASLTGNYLALPVQSVDPPEQARVRNCTFHTLIIKEPVRITISSQQFPDANTIQINPGSYVIRDKDVEGQPVVFKGEIREGDLIIIRTDGYSQTYSCPGE
jgi:hypothetical protein